MHDIENNIDRAIDKREYLNKVDFILQNILWAKFILLGVRSWHTKIHKLIVIFAYHKSFFI